MLTCVMLHSHYMFISSLWQEVELLSNMAAKRPTAVWVSPGDGRQNRRINYDCSFIFILHFLFHRLALSCSIFIYRYFPLPASDSVQLDSTEHLQHAAWEMKHVMEGQTCVYASGVLTAGPECDAWTDPESFNQYLSTPLHLSSHLFIYFYNIIFLSCKQHQSSSSTQLPSYWLRLQQSSPTWKLLLLLQFCIVKLWTHTFLCRSPPPSEVINQGHPPLI